MSQPGLSALLDVDGTLPELTDANLMAIINGGILMKDEDEPFFNNNPQQFPEEQFGTIDPNMVKFEPYTNAEVPTPADIPPPVISSENYSGPMNFEVTIQTTNAGSKNQWIFSEKLNKIFVMMSVAFPVDFKWDFSTNQRLFVRARPLYSQPQHAQQMVARCIQHCQQYDPSNQNMPSATWAHVMRCQNSNAIYEGSREMNQHYSVKVPLGLPQSGDDYVRQMYMFVCKNSCPGNGMNRRPIDVVFTLEDEQARIWGRKVYSVRICSCPKRDKEKEEKEIDNKTKMSIGSGDLVPQGKKRKTEKKVVLINSSDDEEPTDTEKHHLYVPVLGRAAAYEVYKYAAEKMAYVARNVAEGPIADEVNNLINYYHAEMKKFKKK